MKKKHMFLESSWDWRFQVKGIDVTTLGPAVVVVMGLLVLCLASGGTPPSRSHDTARGWTRPPGHGRAHSSSGHDLTPLTRNRILSLIHI